MKHSRHKPLLRLVSTACLVAACGCGGDRSDAESSALAKKGVRFEDKSASIAYERRSYPKVDGLGGAAWFDYDRDGHLDLYLGNGPAARNALFRNRGDGSFVDVTEKAEVPGGNGTSGVIAGDLDNDGHVDLVLLGAGGVYTDGETPPIVYHARGDGTFEDVTERSGILASAGQTGLLDAVWSGALADPDGDGDLDLFVTAPGHFQTAKQPPGKFFRNDGNMRFTDITAESGLGVPGQGQCAAGFSDYDNDGDVDLFVANCLKFKTSRGLFAGTETAPIQLFRNDGGLRFREVTEESHLGRYLGYWMAVSFADFNNDGHMDLFSTNTGTSDGNPHGLFKNRGDGTFEMLTQAGVGEFEFGWGAAFTDLDNDGFADIFFVGSMPVPPSNTIGAGLGNPGRMLMNQNDGSATRETFVESRAWAETTGLHFENEFTSGLAHADMDQDGFVDMVVVRENWTPTYGSGKPVLLRTVPNGNRWVSVELEGRASNRYAVGARISVEADGLTQSKDVCAGGSFASTDATRLTFGLGKRKLARIVVRWPSGRREAFDPKQGSNRLYRLVEGEGQQL